MPGLSANLLIPLSQALPGTWRLDSRIDRDGTGAPRHEPSLGDDPTGILYYDQAGHFAAQFMRRDRATPSFDAASSGANNSRAISGYDAYFGTYQIDDADGTVTQTLTGALASENVGSTLTRKMVVRGDQLEIRIATSHPDGEAVTRILSWTRIG